MNFTVKEHNRLKSFIKKHNIKGKPYTFTEEERLQMDNNFTEQEREMLEKISSSKLQTNLDLDEIYVMAHVAQELKELKARIETYKNATTEFEKAYQKRLLIRLDRLQIDNVQMMLTLIHKYNEDVDTEPLINILTACNERLEGK